MNHPNDPTATDDDLDVESQPDEQTPPFVPAEAKPSLLDRLRDSLASKRTILARAQERAEAEERRVEELFHNYKRLESARQCVLDDLNKLDATYQRLSAERPAMLERCRAAWLLGNFNSTLAEIDLILADCPAHRALLLDRLAAADAAIKTFKRQHGV